jgi:hypothetical protein
MLLMTITIVSLALAAVMTVVAWRIAREEKRRSDARVAALSSEIHGSGDLPLNQRTQVATSGDLFAPATRPSSSPRAAAVVVGGAVLLVVDEHDVGPKRDDVVQAGVLGAADARHR